MIDDNEVNQVPRSKDSVHLWEALGLLHAIWLGTDRGIPSGAEQSLVGNVGPCTRSALATRIDHAERHK